MYELKVKELKLEFEVIFVLFLQIFMSILWKIISWNAKKQNYIQYVKTYWSNEINAGKLETFH